MNASAVLNNLVTILKHSGSLSCMISSFDPGILLDVHTWISPFAMWNVPRNPLYGVWLFK